eukprot:5991448-Pyramimonas_sp.AAC.1
MEQGGWRKSPAVSMIIRADHTLDKWAPPCRVEDRQQHGLQLGEALLNAAQRQMIDDTMALAARRSPLL